MSETLDLQLDMINKTESWWAILIAKKISRYQSLAAKLQQTFDASLVPEIEQLEKEIAHLKLKSLWEQNEISNFEKKQEIFAAIKTKALISELSDKLSKKLNNKNHE